VLAMKGFSSAGASSLNNCIDIKCEWNTGIAEFAHAVERFGVC
jgi:hypothetical protein